MAQEYYSFMMNSFFATFFILSYPNVYVLKFCYELCYVVVVSRNDLLQLNLKIQPFR